MGYFAAFILLGVALAPTRTNIFAGLLLLVAAIWTSTAYITATGFVPWLSSVCAIVLIYIGVASALWIARMISVAGKARP